LDFAKLARFFQRSASEAGAVACGKAGKLRRMRTFLAFVLIAVMSLQAAAVSLGSYCQHEHDAVAKHVGHHDHEHKKAQQDAYAGTDLDCSMCHVGVIFGLLSELNLVTLSLPHVDPVSVIAGRVPVPPFDRPERPNWVSTP
jgi:hypothetical protein